MINKMEVIREAKKVNAEVGRKKYRQLKNELRTITSEAYKTWWKEECARLKLPWSQG